MIPGKFTISSPGKEIIHLPAKRGLELAFFMRDFPVYLLLC
jgi:hypothetical protein